MSGEIVNRVANSALMTIDLEDFYPTGPRFEIDIKAWLYEGIILKEKEFRSHLKEHNWSQYQGGFVCLFCSSDAIIPSWAYLLVSSFLAPYAKKTIVGSKTLLETVLFQDIISQMDIASYKGKPVIVKGCSNKPIPETAYALLIERLVPVARSIMYGEACSTVPLFKAK